MNISVYSSEAVQDILQFKAFGSTQITYIAEEKTAQELHASRDVRGTGPGPEPCPRKHIGNI